MFEPSEFYTLGVDLVASQRNQVGYRAAVGRFYYAAFLTVRNKRDISSKGANGHQLVSDALRATGSVADAATANRLDDLRMLRKDADYNCTKLIVKRDADKSRQLSKKILFEFGVQLDLDRSEGQASVPDSSNSAG